MARWSSGRLRLAVVIALGAVALGAMGVVGQRLVPALTGLDPTNPAVTLSDIERTVSRMFPVVEITHNDLSVGGAGAVATDSKTTEAPLLFDVREPDEYAQSRIPGAIRVPPDMTAEAFMAAHGKAVAGRKVVFYCAVGVRSGNLVQRTQTLLTAAGARSVLNLRGGIFRWHAAGGRLEAPVGTAAGVHPYDNQWGELLNRTLISGTGAPGTGSSQPGLRQSRPSGPPPT